MREGDIESLRNKAKLDGKPIKSNTIIDRNGDRIHYKVEGKKIIITGTDKYRE